MSPPDACSAALHWFTSDLRLHDNPALPRDDGPIAGVFVLDPTILRRHRAAERRIAFMYATLAALDASLREQGSRLVVVEGEAAQVLPPLAAALGARVVTHATNVEPGARRREALVARELQRDGVTVRAVEAAFVHAPGTIRTGSGGAYQVYGAFARAWEPLAVPSAPKAVERWTARDALDGVGIPLPAPSTEVPDAGEAVARARLDRFLSRAVAAYPEARDIPGVDGTSRLSYHLRWGALSGAEAVRRARAAAAKDPARRAGVRVWTRELAWRDFWAQLLHDRPALARAALRPLGIRWRRDDAALRRWQEGTTGVPIVDAGMRELRATGFMHNRVRMVTASFLTRHLLIDWRLGEAHFMAELIDGQLSQNGGNWQWVSGVGADAQPFHRIFSPLRQGERFDPDGVYVKRWVPELARVPAKVVHQPWTVTPLERRALCPDYPPPVVGLDEGRARALAAFEEARARRR
jgi:deoxyribodipyrimidine photo-lyase